MSDSFLVLYDLDILSMIKRKNPFGFYCVILILNLSRLISPITILILKVCRVWFLKCIFDFQNLTRLISKVCRRRLISQMTLLLISKIYRVWFLKWHFWFPKWDRYGWYSRDSSVGGKLYSRQVQGDTQSIVTSRPNEAESVFYWKKGMCPWIGYRVWVSSSLF